MKRLVINSLLALLCLFGCSDSMQERAEDTKPKAGQYLCVDGTITAAVHIDGSEAGITVFENGKYVYQDLGGSVSDMQPYYLYKFSGLVLRCSYSSSLEFSALVEANENKLNLPYSMQFRYDNTVLDINGDGILDSTQQLSEFSANEFNNNINN